MSNANDECPKCHDDGTCSYTRDACRFRGANDEAAEEWRKIPGHPRHQVSNMGRIKGPQKITVGSKTAQGYLTKIIMVKGKIHNYRVHRLVMLCFVGPSDLEVNHKNAIKTDNRLVNLEYCTRTENSRHAIRAGLYFTPSGKKNGNAKLSAKEAKEIQAAYRMVKGRSNAVELAKKYGIKRTTVSAVVKGTHWSVRGKA